MYQKVMIIGNVGSEAESKFMPDGTQVTNFSVATNRKWTDSKGNPREETVWFRVATWRKLAEICNQYVTKGMLIMVEGRMAADSNSGGPRVWTATDGTPRANYELNALEVKFLGGGNRNAPTGPQRDEETPAREPAFLKNASTGSTGSGTPASSASPEDEIPF